MAPVPGFVGYKYKATYFNRANADDATCEGVIWVKRLSDACVVLNDWSRHEHWKYWIEDYTAIDNPAELG